MNTSNKGLYGLLAFGPLGLVILGIVGIFAAAIADAPNHSSEPPAVFWLFMVVMLVAGVLSLVSLIMFIVHASRNPALDDGARIGWIVGLVMMHNIVTIVYFFMYIAKDQPPVQAGKGQGYGQPQRNEWDDRLDA